MKKFINSTSFALAFCLGTIAAAQDYYTINNQFGGIDIYQYSQYQGRTTKNIFGGQNFYSKNGTMIGRSINNRVHINPYYKGNTNGSYSRSSSVRVSGYSSTRSSRFK